MCVIPVVTMTNVGVTHHQIQKYARISSAFTVHLLWTRSKKSMLRNGTCHLDRKFLDTDCVCVCGALVRNVYSFDNKEGNLV